MIRIALDLLGEGRPVAGLLEALPIALDADPRLTLILVTGVDGVAGDLARLGIIPGARVQVRSAARSVPPGPEAVHVVRARRDCGVRVAARLVRDGHADALVSVAPAEAVVAAAQFTHGLLPGATRAVLATDLGGTQTGAKVRSGGVTLCDAGAAPAATSDELVQAALLAAVHAQVRGTIGRPRVGLLSPGPALVDPSSDAVGALLRELDVDFAGLWTADRALAAAGLVGRADRRTSSGTDPAGAPRDVSAAAEHRLDVLVTEGRTGAVLVSAVRALWPGQPSSRRDSHGGPPGEMDEDRDVLGGTIVLGVDAVATQAGRPGGGSVDAAGSALVTAVRTASLAVRGDLVDRTRAAMAALVSRRRALAGMLG
ncbi:phosphate starvation-inducible protein PhoH [Frankia sp. R82]|uniref:phosphate starvation-inducible protein PhoH n=1 Tax=Frankia sp. R82 TaxID=2950553 RepID=UPI002044254D|nr:phosphate starvation-inducible protein PhoH [Frankia sp. R82]MCM3887233.1 phosphate starvation-inducible protein PhoH [Frankia sp. R82]